jgi:hypothetical protein
VVAGNACSVKAGQKLAAFHDKGELRRLPNVRLLLQAIGRTYRADPVVDFVIDHADLLLDTERMSAFCAEPLSYSLYVKGFDQGVAEQRQARVAQDAQKEKDLYKLYAMGGGVLLLVYAVWRSRRNVVV